MNTIAPGISCGFGQISHSIPSERTASITSAWNAFTVFGTSGSTRREPSLTTMCSAWSTRSKSIWNTRLPLHGIGLVVRPVAVTYSVTCAQSGSGGASLRRIFPATCVQR